MKTVATLCLVLALGTPAPAQPPNIVLILADDLGAHDLACDGADLHETPHLDQLARDGVRFTRACSPSPVCSPARAAILTGKSPARLRMTIWSEGSLRGPTSRKLLQAESRHDLPHAEVTLADRLQAVGYLTAAVGKWHLGDADHAPETQGFDVNIGGTRWGAPQSFFWPYRGAGRFAQEFRYVPHLEFGQPGEYLTDRLTDEALRVIDQSAAQRKPFLLYLAHHAPHTPIEARPDDVAHFRAKLQPDLHHQNPTYAAMVRSLDESVGRVLRRLRERGLEENSIVVFASDNGGYIGTSTHDGKAIPVTSNSPLRSGKGTCYEGGLRVPLIVKWPGHAAAGAECHQPVVLTDLFPTLLAVAGLTPDPQVPVDGLNLAPVLKSPAVELPRKAIHFHYPHYYFAPDSTPVSAIRAGDWKLLQFYEDQHVELYNLASDPAEERDLSATESARAADLRNQLQSWLKDVDAALPTTNAGDRARP